MGKRDPRMDAYISKAGEFAQPILKFIREAVHKGCPDVTETMKWSMPFFVRKGILCNMAAFKEHCSFGFWKNGAQVVGEAAEKSEGMGHFGRISRIKDLPSEKQLIAFIKEAARLDESGVKVAKPKPKPRAPLAAPEDLLAALRKSKKAADTFENLSPSHRREYIEWITEAKREETRQKRLEQTVAWLTDGKPRHWKRQNC